MYEFVLAFRLETIMFGIVLLVGAVEIAFFDGIRALVFAYE